MTTSSLWRYAASAATMTVLAVLTACGTPERGTEAAQNTAIVALNDTQLGRIRGGFDLSPNLSINFGFQQTTSVNNQQVSQILIPDLTIGPSYNGGADKRGNLSNSIYTVVPTTPTTPYGRTATGTPSSQSIVPTVVANNGGVGTTASTPSTAVMTPIIVPSTGTSGVTTSSILPNTQAGIASPGSKASSALIPSVSAGSGAGGGLASNLQSQVSVVQDQGVTNIMTQLGGGGLTSIIQSNANNTLVRQATTINLAISGLAPLLSVQSSNFTLNTALALGAALRH
jgi:hypothetical protein